MEYVVDVFPPGVAADSCKVAGGSGLLGGVCAEKILQPVFKVEVLCEPVEAYVSCYSVLSASPLIFIDFAEITFLPCSRRSW